jgi:RNA polymerase sigma factor (sigma-70 family)
MAGGHIGRALGRLQGLLGARDAGGPSDGALLRRYVHARDEFAFEALLRRYGPMVLGVCRRLLGSSHDVDDAFQATFLILVRKAPAIGDGERVGSWLYGVAYRVAIRARAQAARDRARHQPLADTPCPESPPATLAEEVRTLVDEEVSRLPVRYREAVVCCYFEGRTQEEAARLLGWPKGTVATRLNRARELLRSRLVRRGLPVSAGTLLGVLGHGKADAAVPPLLVRAALHTATQSLTSQVLPPAVSGLTGGLVRQIVLARATTVAIGLVSLALATGTAGLVYRTAAARDTRTLLADARPMRGYAWDTPPLLGGGTSPRSGADRQPSKTRAAPTPPRKSGSKAPAGRPGDPPVQLAALVLAPDCKLVAWVGADGTVTFWHQGPGRARISVKGGASLVGMQPLTPDDQRLAEYLGLSNAISIQAAPGNAVGQDPGHRPTVTITIRPAEVSECEAEEPAPPRQEACLCPRCGRGPQGFIPARLPQLRGQGHRASLAISGARVRPDTPAL